MRLPNSTAVLLIAALATGCGKMDAARADKAEGPAKAAAPVKDAPPKADRAFPPADWTHKELADYLKNKGVPVVVSAVPPFDGPGRLAAYFSEDLYYKDPTLVVHRCDDAVIARTQAGAMGTDAFAFGHFAIGYAPHKRGSIDDGALMRRVTAVLKR